MTSTGSGSRCSGSAPRRSATGEFTPSERSAGPSPCALRPGGMQPAGQLAQLAAGQPGLLARLLDHRQRLLGRALGRAERDVERLAEHDEALLRAVVQVAPDPAALLVGGVQEPGARRRHLGLARAQRGLVAAPLELGRRARGEDAQDRELLLARVDLRAREHADVADRRAGGAVHRHAEVAVEPVADDEGVAREAPHGARRVADDVDALDRLAGRVGERVLVALGQQLAARPAGEDAGARRGLGVGELGDVGDVGRERGGEAARERAQEGGADRAGGALRDRPEQVALVVRGRCGRCEAHGVRAGGDRHAGF